MPPAVCLLDDDRFMRGRLASALASEGWRVVEHHPTPEAPTPAEAVSCDVFLVDVVMRDFDGFEVLRFLSRTGDRRPVVVYSRGLRDYALFAEKLGAAFGLTVQRNADLRYVVEAVRGLACDGGGEADS